MLSLYIYQYYWVVWCMNQLPTTETLKDIKKQWWSSMRATITNFAHSLGKWDVDYINDIHTN